MTESEGDVGFTRPGDPRAAVDEAVEADATSTTAAATEEREFDWRGWILVGVIVLSFVVIPGLVLLRPPGLPYYVALLVFPLLPAVILGITAVWATTRP